MPNSNARMKLAAWIFLAAGAGLFVVLVVRQGAAGVASTVSGYGWGLVWISLYHLVPLAAATLAWRAIMQPESRLPLARIFAMRWIGESVNNLLPVGQVGGDLVRARLAALKGVPIPAAAAGVFADYTAGLLSEAVFAAAGIALLAASGARSGALLSLSIGLAAFVLLLAGFYLFQRKGIAPLARAGARLLKGRGRSWVEGEGAAIEGALARAYGRRRAFLACCAFRLLSWVLGAGEVWLAMVFLGRASILDAIAIESLIQAVRSAAFFVPGALGVQESGLLLLGSLAGLDPASALSLSLVKRVREIALGVPGIIAWQVMEGGRLFGTTRVRAS